MRIANLRNLLAACVFLSVIVCPAAGKIIYVNDDAGGANDGTSWTDAYTDLQSALVTSISSDQIWVAAGTYKPGPLRSHSFEMKNGVGIYGGFAGNEDPNLLDPADRDFTTNETILSGDLGVVGNNADNSYHVIYNRQGTTLDSSAVLEGFTITGGYADVSYPECYGGGIFNYSCSPTVINCTFRDNLAEYDGGMGNFSYSSPTVINCVFYNNSTTIANTGGGGMYNGLFSEPIVTNCTFSGNSAGYGGGIYNQGYSQPVVTNCILWADSATLSGDEIFHFPDSTPVVTYSDVQAGTGQSWFGAGCIDDDPCFAGAAAGDFHLLFNSLCINAGNNSAPNLPSTDFEGDSRIVDGVVDMGADEWLRNKLVCLADPPAGGSFTLDPDGGYYEPDTVVTVTANPAGGYVFDYWSGDLTGSANPNTIVMNDNKTITAHFTFTGIIYVNDDANGANNGDSWANAFTDLQDALQVANAGLEIRVAAGTYKPTIGTDPTASFQMKNGVGIYGGFAGDEDPCSFDLADRDFTTNESILSGDIGIPDVNTDNCYRVIYNQQGTTLDSSAVLDGFTITGSSYSGSIALEGGMMNEGASNYPCSPTVTNCTFRDNHAQYGGGMVNTNYSSPTVTNCTFSGNSSYSFDGGGMYNGGDSNPTVTNCTFRDNLALIGGGMGNGYSSPTVTNCTFHDNLAEAGGGMSNRTNCSPTVTNCTFRGNSSTSGHGGGMYNSGGSPTVTNCTFSGNEALINGGGMHNSGSSPTVTNCIFIGNSTTSTYFYSGGGGMYSEGGSPTVTNCTFSGNEALVNGGGMFNGSCSPTVAGCIFIGNSAGNGGGMYNSGSSPTVTNCTFSGNEASGNGGGMYGEGDSPTVTNCILWGDLPDEIYNYNTSPNVTYSDVRGGWGDPNDPNNTNIDADPCFVDTNNPDPNLCNLRLKADSPCIDAGDTTAVPGGIWADLGGNPRVSDDTETPDTGISFLGLTVDIGAYEFHCSGIAGDINCDGVVDFKDLAILCGNWLAGTEP